MANLRNTHVGSKLYYNDTSFFQTITFENNAVAVAYFNPDQLNFSRPGNFLHSYILRNKWCGITIYSFGTIYIVIYQHKHGQQVQAH